MEIENRIEKNYVIQFYNRFACETQRYEVKAVDSLEALKKFRLRYPREF